jgi:hypothetical protein
VVSTIAIASLSNSDFYVTTATVIPVVFLALILEGGLWAWIGGRITADVVATLPTRFFVSLLQLFAVLILIAGVGSEILALHVLLQQRTTPTTQNIVFYSTILLVILLGLVLAARVPGLFIVSAEELLLELEDGEELRWSGKCARLVMNVTPWLWGKLLVTDRRVVWMTNKELGLFGATPIEIRSESLAIGKNMQAELFWLAKLLPSNNLMFTPPQGYFFGIAASVKKVYWFCTVEKREELVSHLNALIQSSSM